MRAYLWYDCLCFFELRVSFFKYSGQIGFILPNKNGTGLKKRFVKELNRSTLKKRLC